MIGAGIFVLPGVAAAEAGPAVALAFVLGGCISLLTAISASELGTAMPRAGGSYFFINHALGPMFGCIAGWGNWMGLAFASAFYALGFGSYVSSFAGMEPDAPINLLVTSIEASQVFGLAAGALFIGVNYAGAKETGRLQNIIVITLVAILAVFMTAGIMQADMSTLRPLAPMGWGAIFPATALVFVSFLGFAQITTVAEEIKNPGKNLPIAVIGSVVIVTVIYAVVMLVLMGVINWDKLASFGDTAVVEVAAIVLGTVGVVMLTAGGLLATASSANASILASSRINFAMGRDKLVHGWLNAIHEKFKTPSRSILVTGILILGFILIGDVETLAKAGAVLHLIVYGLLNISLIVMRTANPPEYQPDFKAPLYPFIPIVGAITSFGLIAFMEPNEIMLSGLFVVGGIIWYFMYARSRTEKQGILSQYILNRPDEMPAAAAAAAHVVQPEKAGYNIMVPLANPAHEKDLITMAAAVAKQTNGRVTAVHIVAVPNQLSLEAGAEHIDKLDAESGELLAQAQNDAETLGVPVDTHTIMAHRVFREIFDAAETYGADLVMLGWGEDSHGSPGRVESALGDIAGELPCDFAIIKNQGIDASRVLVPTNGGPDSDVSAAIASVLRDQMDAEITLMNVATSGADPEEQRAFLTNWADEHDLAYDDLVVAESDDIADAIVAETQNHTMLILGATERGLMRRLTRGTVLANIVDNVDKTVIIGEKAHDRSLIQRLFGRGARGR